MYGTMTTSLPVTGAGAALVGSTASSFSLAIFAFLAFWTLIAALQVGQRVLPKKEV